MRPFLLLLLFLLCFPAQSLFSAQTSGDKSVVVEGYGANKKDALLQAKRSAVEEGIGIVLSSQTEVENFLVKKDKVITQTFGSVRSYKLLQEKKQGEGWYVKIRAVVSLDSITADLMALKILLISMDKPRTMVLIEEKGEKSAEAAIVDYFLTKGFDLVDPAQAATLMAKDDPFIRKAIAGDPIAAAKLGADNGAEYIVVGSVAKSLLENDFLSDTGMKSGQASLTVKVVNCSSARLVATKSSTGAAVHVTPGIAKSLAAAKAATSLMDNKLFEAIVASFQDSINNGANYDVSIVGVKSYRLQKKISKLLEESEGVVSVTKRSYGGGKLELSVLFKGSVDTFCDRVDSQMVAGSSLLVTDVVGSRVVMELQKQQ